MSLLLWRGVAAFFGGGVVKHLVGVKREVTDVCTSFRDGVWNAGALSLSDLTGVKSGCVAFEDVGVESGTGCRDTAEIGLKSHPHLHP